MHIYSDQDLAECVNVLRGYGAARVWLFGGGLSVGEMVSDLDLACEGVAPARFYEAAGRLVNVMRRPVDLVDVSIDSRLSRQIRSRGRLIYDAG